VSDFLFVASSEMTGFERALRKRAGGTFLARRVAPP